MDKLWEFYARDVLVDTSYIGWENVSLTAHGGGYFEVYWVTFD